jgi:hypothetical protein
VIALGPLLVASVLLVLGGGAKVLRPHDTARALRRAGLPGGALAVRIGAGAEVVVGAAACTIGGPVPALLVAASYTVFAVFVTLALARGWALSTCGCFGQPDTPPTWLHVVIDASAALGAAAASAGHVGSPVAAIVDRPAWGVALVCLAGVTTALAFLALTRLPKLAAA